MDEEERRGDSPDKEGTASDMACEKGPQLTCVNNVVGCDSLVDFGFLLVFSFLGLLALFLGSMFTEFIGSEGQCEAAHGSVPGLLSSFFSVCLYQCNSFPSLSCFISCPL